MLRDSHKLEEDSMRVRYLACVIAVLIAGFVISRAQESKTTVKREAAPMTSPASGKEMFVSYCASCHGHR